MVVLSGNPHLERASRNVCSYNARMVVVPLYRRFALGARSIISLNYSDMHLYFYVVNYFMLYQNLKL